MQETHVTSVPRRAYTLSFLMQLPSPCPRFQEMLKKKLLLLILGDFFFLFEKVISTHKIISSFVVIHVCLQKCFQVWRNKDLTRSLSLSYNTRELLPASCTGDEETQGSSGLLTSLLCFPAFKKHEKHMQLAENPGVMGWSPLECYLFHFDGAFGVSPFVLRSSVGCNLIAHNPSVYFVTKAIYIVI